MTATMGRAPILHPYGDRGVLVELASGAEVLTLHERARLAFADKPEVLALVPGARTLLIESDPARCTPRMVAELLRPLLHDLWQAGTGARSGDTQVVIGVRYDGPDLAQVAAETGLSESEVVELHTGAVHRVQFCGFSPGFAYLTGLPAQLRVGRLPTPRTAVPAGSVAVADEFSGVYPRRSPGGWRLIGSTDAVLFDVDRDPPALLAPGTEVTFRAL